jgi:hypothetical protein
MFRFVLASVAALGALLVALPAFLLVLPVWLMAAAVHAYARRVEPPVAGPATDEALMRFDPLLGWRPEGNLGTHYIVRRDDIYPIITDSEGWPGKVSLEECDVVVVGDSFATGYGARTGEAFWDLVSGFRIKPVGSAGYDLVQELELLRLLRDRLAGRLVIWLIYLENDIADSLRPSWRGYPKPFVRRSSQDDRWEIVAEHVREDPWRHSTLRPNMEAFAGLCTPGPFADLHYSACSAILSMGRDIIDEAHAELIVATVPNVNQLTPEGHRRLKGLADDARGFDPDYPDRRLAESCARLDIPFLAMKSFLEEADYKEFERFHWNPGGHRKVARQVERIHAEWRAGRLARHFAPEAGEHAVPGAAA